MQTTATDEVLAPATQAESRALMDAFQPFKLVIASKNHSSWSMRAWVAMKAFDVPFEEVLIPLGRPDTSQRIAEWSPSGRLPVLIAGQHAVWDSLAICDFLAERFPEIDLWPRDPAARAVARSVTAEMHSSFHGLRAAMPMNVRARLPGQGRTPEAQADVGRICEIWEQCLRQFGHHEFLFGDFSIADAFYAPVVTRFVTYDVALAPALQAYAERVLAHPAVAEWVAQAEAEAETPTRPEP